MFYVLVKFKPDTLIINHFIIKYKLHGMVTRRSLCWVPWSSTTSFFFQCYSLHFITFLARYTEVKYHLKQSFYMNIKFDQLLSEINHVLQNGECNLIMSA